MNTNIKDLFRSIGKLQALIYPFSFYKMIRAVKNYIYSGYISKQFKSCGDNFYVQYPIYLIGGINIEIGKNFNTYARLRIEAHDRHLNENYTPRLLIGDNVSINYDCHLACINKIIIENNVLMGSKIFITDHYHGKIDAQAIDTSPNLRNLYSPGPVHIKSNVWIGENVSIMPNITIGENSIIGANSVVTKSFPKNSVIAGVPAKLIKSI